MIKIKLERKKREELEDLFLKHFCYVNSLNRGVQKYEKIEKKIEEAKKYCGYKTDIFAEYGYPFANNKGKLDTIMVKKVLLIKPSELNSVPSSDRKILELQFYYQLCFFEQIMLDKSNPKYINNLFEWGNKAIPIMVKYFEKKKYKKGKKVDISKVISGTEFAIGIKKGNAKYIEGIYEKYKDYIYDLKQYMGKVFDYSLIKNDSEFKYKISNLLGIEVCPYCNRQFISYIDKLRRTTFTLDHYKREATYPFLKLSLYNLVPSCSVCNSTLKNTSDLEHLNPWEDDNGGIRFTYKKGDGLSESLADYYKINNLENIEKIEVEIDRSYCTEKAKNSIEVFKLDELYKTHNLNASMLVAKAIKYEVGNYKRDLLKILRENEILDSEKMLDVVLYGELLDGSVDEKAKNIPLYKMGNDLVNEIRNTSS